ncbi:MAG: hypothetical protein PHY30_03465 [Candidatus Pacebacteria bacterium]|nr:hypothetical protein [Candidatus Paceibacterota bacterium]
MLALSCKNIEKLVNRNVALTMRALQNGAYRLADCPKFPDVIIALLRGYTESQVSEEGVLSVLNHLNRKGVMTFDFKERVKCLEAYSELKDKLSRKIIFALR